MKKSFIIAAIICFALFALTLNYGWGATYYMLADGTNADPDCSETSACCAGSMDMTDFNAASFSADDIVYMCDDSGTYRATMTVPSSGSVGQPITIAAYTGDAPIISGADIISGNWSGPDGNGEYTDDSIDTEPQIVFVDGVKWAEGSVGTLGATEWAWTSADGGTLWMGANPAALEVEAGQRNSPVQSAQNYIVFDGLHVTKGNTSSFYNGGDNVTIQNCEVDYSAHHGIANVGSQDNLIYNNTIHHNGSGAQTDSAGIFSYKTAASSGHENYIRSNSVYNNRSFGIYIMSNYYVIENNTVYDNGNTTDMTSGIEIFNNDNDGYARYNVVRENIVYGQISGVNNGEGILFDDFSAYNTAYYNVVYGNDGPGMGMWKSNNNSFYNNVVYGNCLNSGAALTTKTEIAIDANGGGITDNNVIKNNIAQATQADTYAIWIGPYSYNSSGLDITNNIYETVATNWYFWNDGGGDTLATWNALTGVGTDINSDPLLTDVTNDLFTLTGSSPAIQAGVDVSLTTDYNGNPVCDTPSIGAYDVCTDITAGSATITLGTGGSATLR